MISRTAGYAAIARGEKWTLRWCPGCNRRRMMPETEVRCLTCQETGGRRRLRVLYLPGLRTAREQVGLSREELELLVGLTRYRLHLIEAGEKRVKMRTARKIAAALGTTVDVIISVEAMTEQKVATWNERGAA